MSRTARIVVEEVPCHITQRGNNRQDIFFVSDDYKAYLDILKEQAEKYDLSILGYCLMTKENRKKGETECRNVQKMTKIGDCPYLVKVTVPILGIALSGQRIV